MSKERLSFEAELDKFGNASLRSFPIERHPSIYIAPIEIDEVELEYNPI